mgnify:CR=1 FL=1
MIDNRWQGAGKAEAQRWPDQRSPWKIQDDDVESEDFVDDEDEEFEDEDFEYEYEEDEDDVDLDEDDEFEFEDDDEDL